MKVTVFLDNKITPYRTEEKSLSFRNKKTQIKIKQKENKKIIPYANVLCNRRSSGMNSRCYYICAHFSQISFAHSFHLRTEMYIICAQFYCYICARVFRPLPWPAAGILLNQGTTHEVSSLLSLFTGLGVKSGRSHSPGLFFLVVMFESPSKNHCII